LHEGSGSAIWKIWGQFPGLVTMQSQAGIRRLHGKVQWEGDLDTSHVRRNTWGVIPRWLGYDRNLSENPGVSDPLCPVLLLILPARTNCDFLMN
jgi:hypothetical protein